MIAPCLPVCVLRNQSLQWTRPEERAAELCRWADRGIRPTHEVRQSMFGNQQTAREQTKHPMASRGMLEGDMDFRVS